MQSLLIFGILALQRQQTHISSQRIVRYIFNYPHLKSFLQGYLVHCLSDEIELGHIFFQHFPFFILKRKMSRQQIAAILEIYFFENERSNKACLTYNEVLSELGLSEETSTKFSQSISRYIISSSPKSRLSDLFYLLGLENDSQTDKYMSAVKSFQKNWFLKNALFFEIRTSKISEQIVSKAASLYQHCGV